MHRTKTNDLSPSIRLGLWTSNTTSCSRRSMWVLLQAEHLVGSHLTCACSDDSKVVDCSLAAYNMSNCRMEDDLMKIINILWTDFDQTAIQSICVYWYRIHQSPCMVQHPCNTTTTTTHSVDSLAETNTFGIAAWTSWTTESGSSLGRFVGGPTGSFWKLPQGKTSASHGLGLDKLAAQFYQVYVE